ncbi:MAG: HD domain-containing protein [Planctomycetes bacterium]|nr:HD domain-containing protein [Planctomycetota bacterium]
MKDETIQRSAVSPRVRDLRKGDRIEDSVFLVETSNFKQTRNQKYFIQMSLRDASGAIKAIRWEATADLYRSFGVDDFLRIQGRVEEFQGQLQVIVDGLEKVPSDEIDASRFLPVCPLPIDQLEAELNRTIDEIAQPGIKALLAEIVRDPEIRDGLLRCPAGKSLHHAYVGGLLHHIVSLMGAIRAITRHYERLDRDILFAAAVLHDLGKIREMSYTKSFSYTDAGQLVGHLGLGLILLHDKAQKTAGLPAETLLHLQHIIASHHGVPEYGTLKLPMTAEAIVFHYLDNMDAKLAGLDAMEEELPPEGDEERQNAAGRWSDYKPHLSRKIYFPRRPEE